MFFVPVPADLVPAPGGRIFSFGVIGDHLFVNSAVVYPEVSFAIRLEKPHVNLLRSRRLDLRIYDRDLIVFFRELEILGLLLKKIRFRFSFSIHGDVHHIHQGFKMLIEK